MFKTVRIRELFATLLICFSLVSGASAGPKLDNPSGPVILTVGGSIGVTNVGETAVFDIAMLEALGPVTISTSTIWTDGLQEFVGVPLGRVMEAVDAKGGILRVSAINDYSVDIPFGDAISAGPILAYERNGRRMSVRDKGPLWIVYPYDSNDDFQTESVYSRSVWQLDEMLVLGN